MCSRARSFCLNIGLLCKLYPQGRISFKVRTSLKSSFLKANMKERNDSLRKRSASWQNSLQSLRRRTLLLRRIPSWRKSTRNLQRWSRMSARSTRQQSRRSWARLNNSVKSSSWLKMVVPKNSFYDWRCSVTKSSRFQTTRVFNKVTKRTQWKTWQDRSQTGSNSWWSKESLCRWLWTPYNQRSKIFTAATNLQLVPCGTRKLGSQAKTAEEQVRGLVLHNIIEVNLMHLGFFNAAIPGKICRVSWVFKILRWSNLPRPGSRTTLNKLSICRPK